jgi:hypothetical protein
VDTGLETGPIQKRQACKDASDPKIHAEARLSKFLLFEQSASADKPMVDTDFNPWRAS